MKYLNEHIYRLLDANMNRAVEGIRVLEETARMIFDDSELTGSLKNIRHKLVGIVKSEKHLDRMMLLARGSERDVLRNGETESEKTRDDVASVVRSNAGRAQEAIRSMEEFVKLTMPALSERFKNIRFSLYDIEKELVLRIHAERVIDRIRQGLFIIIENDEPDMADIYEITRAVTLCGASTVMYRDRISHDRAYFTNAERMLKACRNVETDSKPLCATIIDNRLDVAMILGADGVHLNTESIPVKACRGLGGERLVIGSTIHNKPLVDEEMIDELDYLIVAPVFDKTHEEKNDLKILCDIMSRSRVPVIASGGVTTENVRHILDSGVTGIAVKTYSSNFREKLDEIKKLREIVYTYSSFVVQRRRDKAEHSN